MKKYPYDIIVFREGDSYDSGTAYMNWFNRCGGGIDEMLRENKLVMKTDHAGIGIDYIVISSEEDELLWSDFCLKFG